MSIISKMKKGHTVWFSQCSGSRALPLLLFFITYPSLCIQDNIFLITYNFISLVEAIKLADLLTNKFKHLGVYNRLNMGI